MFLTRRRIFFSLLVGLGILGCGWYVYRRSQLDAQAVQAIEDLGGTVRDGSYGRAVDLCLAEIADRDLAVLAKLSNLDQLDLRYSQITDEGLASLAQLRGLANLNLAHTTLTGEGLQHIRDLRLVGLHLQSTYLNDAGAKHLAGMTSLQRLNLGSTNVTDESVESLAQLSRLDALNLSSTDVTASAIAQLQNALPNADIYAGNDRSELMPNSELMLPGEPVWAISTGHRTVRVVGELKSPIQLIEAMGFADGGTQGARLRDATGQELIFCFTPEEEWVHGYLPERAYIGGFHASSPGCRLLPTEGEELPRLLRYVREAIAYAKEHPSINPESDEQRLVYAESLLTRLENLAKRSE